MNKITLDKVIENLENPNIPQLTLDTLQLREWLKELRDARKLIKSQSYYIETHIDDRFRR